MREKTTTEQVQEAARAKAAQAAEKAFTIERRKAMREAAPANATDEDVELVVDAVRLR